MLLYKKANSTASSGTTCSVANLIGASPREDAARSFDLRSDVAKHSFQSNSIIVAVASVEANRLLRNNSVGPARQARSQPTI